MAIEIRYFSAKKCSRTYRKIVNSSWTWTAVRGNCKRIVIQNRKDSAAKKGFADHGGEMFYVDYVEPGNPKKRRSYCGLGTNRKKNWITFLVYYRPIFLSGVLGINLNLESFLTLNVEKQHAVTHFKNITFALYEYAQISGTSVEEEPFINCCNILRP